MLYKRYYSLWHFEEVLTHLDLRKLTGNQLGEAAVLALEYLPNILEIANAGLPRAQHALLLHLKFKNHTKLKRPNADEKLRALTKWRT